MITKVRVENFQSLVKTEVELGKLTVMVGPSNSGKSALLRALKVLAMNAASPAFVTTGKRSSFIMAALDDEERAVALERGKALSTYRIFDEGGEQTYAKAGTSVPGAVQQVLRFAEVEGDSLNFAFQFDPPFLLSEPSTKAAKVLGDLTNISVLHDAVREANRRRLEANGRLKVRLGDLTRLKERASEFADIPDRRLSLEAMRETLEAARAVSFQLARVRALVGNADLASAAVVTLRERKLPPDPQEALAAADLAVELCKRLRGLIAQVENLVSMRSVKKRIVAECDSEAVALEEQHHATLVRAGRCPVCGQTIQEEA